MKTIFSLGLILALCLMFAAISCQNDDDDDDNDNDDDDDNDDNGGAEAEDQSHGDCLPGTGGYDKADDDDAAPAQESIALVFSNGVLSVTHEYAYRACDWPMEVTYDLSQSELVITEGEPARDALPGCMCCFNAEYQIPSVPAASLQLTVIEKYYDGENFNEETALSETVDFSAQSQYDFPLGDADCL